MAAKRKRNAIDYNQLNLLSSAVLYNENKTSKKGKLYEAERLIEKRMRGRVGISSHYFHLIIENIRASLKLVIGIYYQLLNWLFILNSI